MKRAPVTVSIIIPVFNKVAFTRQCLASIARHASDRVQHQVIVVDNASSDETDAWLKDLSGRDPRVLHIRNETNLGFSRANNVGAELATGRYVLFLNNDTIVQPGWLEAMVDVAEADPRVGIVGIKQLFPYTNRIHHTGMIFGADRRPQHIYPHADASLPHVNKQREYQSVTGSCLLMPRQLFVDCGMFDEGYRNGYEDVDLCLTVRARERTVVCCTRSFIYHYGQITETRTADDDANLLRFMSRWGDRITPDELTYFRADQKEIEASRHVAAGPVAPPASNPDLVYFADDLSSPSALTWVTSELVLALHELRLPVAIRKTTLHQSTEPDKRRVLERLMAPAQPHGGVQIRWSHYWPQHLGLELTGSTNLELFVINYLFERPGTQPWDYWLQCLAEESPREAPAEHVLSGRAPAGRRARGGLLHPAPRLLPGGAPGRGAAASIGHAAPVDGHQLARPRALRHEAAARGVLARVLVARRRGPGDEGLRRLVGRHLAPADARRAVGSRES